MRNPKRGPFNLGCYDYCQLYLSAACFPRLSPPLDVIDPNIYINENWIRTIEEVKTPQRNPDRCKPQDQLSRPSYSRPIKPDRRARRGVTLAG